MIVRGKPYLLEQSTYLKYLQMNQYFIMQGYMALNQIFFDTYCTKKMSNHCNPELHTFIRYLHADNLASFVYCFSISAVTAGLFPSSVSNRLRQTTFSAGLFGRTQLHTCLLRSWRCCTPAVHPGSLQNQQLFIRMFEKSSVDSRINHSVVYCWQHQVSYQII